jgi:ketosteroid isomerase-like protein
MTQSWTNLGSSFRNHSVRSFILLLLVAVLLGALPAAAQKKKKNAPPPDDPSLTLPLPDEKQVDLVISDMLGAWQLGDIEKLHKDYADDVTVVNGIYAPPVLGWNNFLVTYQQQRARMQRVRLDRANTYIKVDGNIAWACYQWDFSALVDEHMSAAQGQTTLVLQKRNAHWVIVLNHTSLAQDSSGTPKPAEPAIQPKSDSPAASKPTSR